MSLTIQCPGCNKNLKVPETMAGKSGKCPNCGISVSIPAQPEPIPVLSSAPVEVKRQSQPPAVPTRPPEYVPGHDPRVPTINVNLPRRTSSLGVASLVLGIVAFVICWIPLIGMLGVPLSLIGLLLGVIGLVVAVVRKGAGIGFPIAGSAICGLALVIAFTSTYAAGKALQETGKVISEAAEKGNRTNQEVVGTNGGAALPILASNRPQTSSGAVNKAGAKAGSVEWASAANTIKQGDMAVRVKSVVVGKVPLNGIAGQKTLSTDDLLTIGLDLTNIGKTKKLDYRSWAGEAFSFGTDSASLRDSFDNSYKRINFGFASKPVGAVASESLYPGKAISDVLVFERPIDSAQYLNLELPAANFGGQGMLRIRIDAKMIRR